MPWPYTRKFLRALVVALDILFLFGCIRLRGRGFCVILQFENADGCVLIMTSSKAMLARTNEELGDVAE